MKIALLVANDPVFGQFELESLNDHKRYCFHSHRYIHIDLHKVLETMRGTKCFVGALT